MSRNENSKLKPIILGLAALVIVGGIGYGAYKGRTQDYSPAQTRPDAGGVSDNSSKSDASTKEEDDKGLIPVRTWTRKDCSLAPWLITDKLGYFKEQGIKLVFTGELQPNQQIPSIINGDNDVSSAHPNAIIVADNGGANLVGVVRSGIDPGPDADQKFLHMWWYVNPKKYPDVKTIADLKNIKGKLKFSTITTNICTDFLTNTLFKKNGIPIDKIEWVTMPDIQAIQSLKQGLTDVGSVHPPFYKGMDDAGMRKIADTRETDLGASAGVGYYYFTKDFIKKNPDTVKRFIKAIAKGQRWCNAHPEETAKWTQEAIGVPVTGNHYYAEDTTIVESEITPWLEQLEENKVVPKGKFKSADIITHEFEKYGNELK
ncbi:MAG TPA: ABC transporter substrate-binding protein [Clostridia bacterium]